MKEYKSVKEQLLEYYMAYDHNNWTNTVIKVLSCEDPEIEQAPDQYEDLNILVAIPNPRHQNLNVEIDETYDDNMNPTQAESSAQGASRNPPSGVSYDRPSQRPRPTRSHNTTYQSAPLGGSYRSGTGRFQRYNIPEDYAPERKYSADILDIDCVDSKERRRRIQAWHNSLRLIIATDDNLANDFELAHILMVNKSSRMANELISGINKEEFMREIGHMSYECPNTKSSKAQVKAFEEIFLEEALEQYNLAPLETLDDVSDDEELYYLESDIDIESDDYSETSSDFTDQE
ncbi:hypothetical protein D5086_006256 [Populus alba]|uniref:Uncharacterized protein n=1 Tax=Populus alba TaxID=43335 RepID=A0ACC4CM81_POPAL